MKVKLLAPIQEEVSLDVLIGTLLGQESHPPFSESRLECCAKLSRAIFADVDARAFPELLALAFWLRKGELLQLREQFAALASRTVLRFPRGIVFHIPPSNVDTIFVYSWTLALLTGNRNIVRISSKSSPQTLILCRLLRGVLSGPDAGQFFVQYGYDAEVTAALSKVCDVRVVWGGDDTIRAIREFPLPVHAKELTFPDRYSLSAISSAGWLSATIEERGRVTHQFFNDTFWFDQMACSSPRLVVWCGTAGDCGGASRDFFMVLKNEIVRRGYRIEPSLRMQKQLFAARAIVDQPVSDYLTYGPQLAVLELEHLQNFKRDHCGGGLMFQVRVSSLAEIAPYIRRQDQTLTHFGFAPPALEELALLLRGRGLDRIVPIGQALSFGRFWDGYDLLEEMTRAVAIL